MRPGRIYCAESVDNHIYNISAITERLQAYNELNKKKDVCQFEGLCSSTDTPRMVGRETNCELVSYLTPVLTDLYVRTRELADVLELYSVFSRRTTIYEYFTPPEEWNCPEN